MNEYKSTIRDNDGKEIFLGWFDSSQSAAMNYDYHSIKMYGRDGGYLNFANEDYTVFIPKRNL